MESMVHAGYYNKNYGRYQKDTNPSASDPSTTDGCRPRSEHASKKSVPGYWEIGYDNIMPG